MALSNSSSSDTLKFDDAVSVIFSNEVWRKALGDSLVSGSAFNIEGRGRSSVKELGTTGPSPKKKTG